MPNFKEFIKGFDEEPDQPKQEVTPQVKPEPQKSAGEMAQEFYLKEFYKQAHGNRDEFIDHHLRRFGVPYGSTRKKEMDYYGKKFDEMKAQEPKQEGESEFSKSRPGFTRDFTESLRKDAIDWARDKFRHDKTLPDTLSGYNRDEIIDYMRDHIGEEEILRRAKLRNGISAEPPTGTEVFNNLKNYVSGLSQAEKDILLDLLQYPRNK